LGYPFSRYSPSVPLRVMTLNIWNRMGPYARRQERIREWIARLEPDLIGLQEVVRASDVDQLAAITEGLGYSTAFGCASRSEDVEFGNAIASRWPITDEEVLALPAVGNDESRCAVSVTIDAPFGDVSFTCTHLNWKLHDGISREAQVVALADLVLRRRPKGAFPPIVVGDFNAEPESSEIRFMRGFATLEGRSVMFYDAWSVAGDGGPGYTWSNRNAFAAVGLEPERRIDYIFAGYPIRMTDEHGVGRIEACRVVCDDETDGVWPSDHFGLYAELRTDPLGRPSVAMG
jgi:endonuclease/exonuclease/phosphatase family metal-dependent hydrolase